MTDMQGALDDYEKDKYAGSNTRASVARTWNDYHIKAHRFSPTSVSFEAFPMTVEALRRIAALMKADGFRSFGNYASWAKAEHISRGHAWSQQLGLELKAALRSVGRGLGPPRQSRPFDLLAIASDMSKTPSSTSGSPLFPSFAVLLGALWVLREIEIAWAVWADVFISESLMKVSWTLPVSKTDPGAKSCTRTWGCMCAHLSPAVCPYHAFVEYRSALLEFFGPSRAPLSAAAPVFPHSQGKVVTKPAMIAGFEFVFAEAGLACMDDAGRKCFGGHSCRVAGSRFWAANGLDLLNSKFSPDGGPTSSSDTLRIPHWPKSRLCVRGFRGRAARLPAQLRPLLPRDLRVVWPRWKKPSSRPWRKRQP